MFHAPDVSALKEFYKNGVFGDQQVIRFLNRSWIKVARCQSLARWHFVLKSLKKDNENFFNKTISVCDVGAGYGSTLEAAKFLRLALNYYGIESSAKMRRWIQALGGRSAADFFCYGEKQKFDLVWASHILEHYPNPDDFLQRMRGMMAPQGAGFIEVPCLDYEFKVDVTQHLLFFSAEGLKKAIERNGFRVLQMGEVGKRREEMKEKLEQATSKFSLRTKIKQMLPNPLINILSDLYGFSKYAALSLGKSASEDFSSRDTFDQWGLESYGNGRCWIRAVFVPLSRFN